MKFINVFIIKLKINFCEIMGSSDNKARILQNTDLCLSVLLDFLKIISIVQQIK